MLALWFFRGTLCPFLLITIYYRRSLFHKDYFRNYFTFFLPPVALNLKGNRQAEDVLIGCIGFGLILIRWFPAPIRGCSRSNAAEAWQQNQHGEEDGAADPRWDPTLMRAQHRREADCHQVCLGEKALPWRSWAGIEVLPAQTQTRTKVKAAGRGIK